MRDGGVIRRESIRERAHRGRDEIRKAPQLVVVDQVQRTHAREAHHLQQPIRECARCAPAHAQMPQALQHDRGRARQVLRAGERDDGGGDGDVVEGERAERAADGREERGEEGVGEVVARQVVRVVAALQVQGGECGRQRGDEEVEREPAEVEGGQLGRAALEDGGYAHGYGSRSRQQRDVDELVGLIFTRNVARKGLQKGRIQRCEAGLDQRSLGEHTPSLGLARPGPSENIHDDVLPAPHMREHALERVVQRPQRCRMDGKDERTRGRAHEVRRQPCQLVLMVLGAGGAVRKVAPRLVVDADAVPEQRRAERDGAPFVADLAGGELKGQVVEVQVRVFFVVCGCSIYCRTRTSTGAPASGNNTSPASPPRLIRPVLAGGARSGITAPRGRVIVRVPMQQSENGHEDFFGETEQREGKILQLAVLCFEGGYAVVERGQLREEGGALGVEESELVGEGFYGHG